jgi:hypothetical protein
MELTPIIICIIQIQDKKGRKGSEDRIKQRIKEKEDEEKREEKRKKKSEQRRTEPRNIQGRRASS